MMPQHCVPLTEANLQVEQGATHEMTVEIVAESHAHISSAGLESFVGGESCRFLVEI